METKRINSKKKDIVPKKHIVLKHKKQVLITISIVLGLLILFLGYYFIFEPSITLKGKKVIEISYNKEYKDEGATAKKLGKDITKYLKTKGKVNTQKVGEYKIIYSVKKGIFTIEKERIVKVVDKEKPVLTLTGEDKVSVCPNKEYEELGYTAIDNYDKDITKKVKVEKKDNKVIYTIKDSSNNTVEKERTIVKEDKEKPSIELKGNATMYLTLNTKYSEPGYTANDNCDGDITKNVKIEGAVDSSKIGKYTIKYTVTDNEGSITTKERIITVNSIPQKIAVLNYHFFYDKNTEQCNESICIEINNFRKHLDYLKENNYKTLTMKEFNDWMDKKISIPNKSVLITVDDGAMGTNTHLPKLLKEYNMNATLFLITEWWPLSKYEIGNLEIQSHGNDLHIQNYCKNGSCGYKLQKLTKNELIEDLNKSKTKIGNPIAFCYPFYSYNQTSIDALKETGFKLAFIGGNKKVSQSSNKYLIPRYIIYSNISVSGLKKMLN